MDIKQRKYQRFSVQDDAFAALKNDIEKIGRVNDISIKGLALTYLSERVKTGSYRDDSEVEIFLTGNKFYLPKVPCKIVYDIIDPKSDKNHSIMTRRCGLHFGEFSKSQLEQLELFIKNYTRRALSSWPSIGPADDI
jgi:hypothetical protein